MELYHLPSDYKVVQVILGQRLSPRIFAIWFGKTVNKISLMIKERFKKRLEKD